MSFNSDIKHVFESLTLECEFTMKVISKQNNEILLVDLFDSDGNNVAALLIEKLAALTSQISPLPSHRLATSILNKQLTSSPETENGYSPPRSNREKPTWRNTEKTARNFNDDRNCDDNMMAWNSSGGDRRSRNFGDKQTFNSRGKQTFNSGEKQTFNSGDKQSWNSGDKQSWKAGSDADNRKSWRNGHEEKKTWRNNDEAPTKFRTMSSSYSSSNNRKTTRNKRRDRADNWNGDSPTNKRSFQRNDRNNKYDRNDRERSRNNNYQRDGQKFRSDRFNDNKSSPDDKDSGKGNSHWTAGSGSEKSWSGSVGSRSGKKLGPKQDFNKQSRKPNDYGKRKPELPPQDLSPLEEPFKFMEIPIGSNDTVSISWFYNPESFYLQILSHQKEFRDMMCDIQSAYNGRPALDSEIPVGSSIIAEFHEDSILYRAIVLENKHPKYKVQYVDFGNVSLVDCSKIWQVETKFMTRPIQAIKCGLTSLKATDGNWPVSEVIDNIFNKESFTCTFESFIEDQYSVQLFDNDVNLKQQLIDSGIATDAAAVCEMADEPVELNMLVGQNINVHVSFISGLNKFYIQFDKLKAIQVQEYINTFMSTAANINALQQFTVDQLTIGSTCLVKTDEEKWFRGVIMTNTDSNVIQVDFPDFGGSTQLPVEKLFYIPPQLCVHWYQSFECTLHNLTADVNRLVSDDDFKQNYEGQDLIMYVDEVANGRPIVTLYELSGLKLSVFEPDEGAFASVEPLSPFPVLHSTLTVWVSHVNSFDSLYMQRSCDIEKIAQLIETLFEYYESQGEQTEYVEGALCAAKSVSDDNWYRARMEEMSDEGVKVTYIDYGNSEILPITNLKSLDPAFFTPHEFALHVGLNVKELSQDLTNKIKELTADKEFKATVWYAESGWLAEILDGEISINQTLIELNLACPQEEVEVVQDISDEIKQTEEKSEPVVDGSRAQVRITHIDSPSEFYVQLVANEEVVSNLQAELQEEILTLPALEGADVGVLCAAKYSVDEQWYRAEVLDADADITTVRFVDYGNTDVIDNKNSAIKILPADLLAIDKFSAKCSLNYKPIKGEEWSQEACEMFENALNVDLIYADIVYQDEKNKTYVELFIDGTEKNVAELLTKAQLAVPIVRDAEESIASNTGFISHLNSASEFWIQLESSVPDLEMIVDRLATAESFPDLHDLSPGVLCAANFPDDEMWYRARILSNTVAGIEVLFVDYGNSSTAMKLKVLPEDLIQMPALAQKCSLNKPQTVAQWSDQATEKFREISEDGATIFTIKKFTTGETSTVELFINDVNITEQLISLCETGAFRMTPNYVKVNVTYVESPEKFWIQLMSDSLVAESVLESLATASDLKHVTEWKENTIYAALFDDNGLWYRVKVLSQSEQYEVHLIDYGNVIQTSDIREISESLEKIPQLATLCSLEFPKSVTKWTDDAASKFANFTADVYTEFELEFLNEESPRLVRLYREGKNIAEEIILETPQALLQSSSTTSLVSDMVTLSEEQIKSPVPKSVEEENIKEIEGSVLQTTLYEECDSTLKEVDATFASCGDITASEITLETDNNEVVNEVKPEDLIEDQSFSELKLDDKLVVEGNSSSELSNKLTETQVVSELPNKFTESQVVVSRPTTPHCDKIVPGSVSRGDLEVPPLDIISTLDLNQSLDLIEDLASQQTEKLAVLDEIPKENTADDIKYEALLEANRSRSSTPRCDKVVPGSISRDDLEVPSVERYETVFVTEVDIYVEDVEIDQRQGDTVVSSETSVTNVLDPPNLSSVDKIDDLLINKVDLTKHDISNAEEVVVVDHSQGNTVATSQPCQEAIVLNSLNLPSDNEIDTIINKENLVENVSGTPGKMCRGILEQILLTANNIGNINLTEASDTQSSKETEEIGIKESQRLLETKKSKHKEMKEKQSKKQETKEEKGEEIENLEHDYAKAKEVEKVPSRPMTPRVEKIVPGSICRGDLEEPLISTEKVAKENKIVPGSISRGTSLEEIEDPSLEIEDSSLETPRTPTNRTFSGNMHVPVTLKTRTEDKILPGAISLALNLDESNECASPIIPKTPTEDKIVPGSISRGMNLLDDTSEPSEISETSLDLDDTTDSMSVWPPTPRVKERNIVESVFSLDDKIDLSDSGDTPETLELAESDPESDNSKDSFFSGDMIDRQSSPLLSKDDSTIPEEDDNTIPEKDDNTMPDRTLDEPSVDKVVSGVPERNIYS